MKKYIIISILLAVVVGVILFINMSNTPISKDQFVKEVENKLVEIVKKEPITSAVVTVYSEKMGLDSTFAVGATGKNQDVPVEGSHPYHITSIGKVFTATLIGMLHDKGSLSFDDYITYYLPGEFLEGLFVYEGVDYSSDVTIAQLVSHTSGVNDYFDGPVDSGEPMVNLLLSNPDKVWTPEELIAFTRDHQTAVGKPGEQMLYSDTGFILLGFIVEAVTKKSFHEHLHASIFEPLSMDDSYMMFLSEPVNKPKKDILELWLKGTDLTRSNALTVDWSGGGIISTSRDLLKFSQALHAGKLVSSETYEFMRNCEYKRFDGLYYGHGIMEFHFGDFFVLLNQLPMVQGGIGASTTYMLYDRTTDTHFIANYGSIDSMEKGVQQLIDILMLHSSIEVPNSGN